MLLRHQEWELASWTIEFSRTIIQWNAGGKGGLVCPVGETCL